MISVEGLTVDFAGRGVRAIDHVDLHLDAGEQIALLGRSGAGKSTLLRALLGAVRPVAGTVRIAGRDPFGPPREVRTLRRSTGVIRQGNDLVLLLTARVNALMGTAPEWRPADWATVARGGVPARWAERLDALAGEHGIAEVLGARVRDLSGGQRQRVALCRALLPGPSLLLADEPTSGLDPGTARGVIAALRDAQDVTLVVATHDLAVARAFPRVVALRDGTVAYDGDDFDEHAAEALYGVRA